MEEFKLYIKNMVCRRCMMAVERLLHDQGILLTPHISDKLAASIHVVQNN